MKKVIHNVYTITEDFFEGFQLENKLSLLVKDIQSRGREAIIHFSATDVYKSLLVEEVEYAED